MWKKGRFLFGFLLAAVFLTSCGGLDENLPDTKKASETEEPLETSEKKPLEEPVPSEETEAVSRGRVLVSLPEDVYRWRKNGDYFVSEFEEAGYECTVLYSDGNAFFQEEALLLETEKGADLVILAPADEKGFSAFTEYVDENGIDTILYDSPVEEMPKESCYVGFKGRYGNKWNEALVVYSVGMCLLSGERADAGLIRAMGFEFPCTFDALCPDYDFRPSFIL